MPRRGEVDKAKDRKEEQSDSEYIRCTLMTHSNDLDEFMNTSHEYTYIRIKFDVIAYYNN